MGKYPTERECSNFDFSKYRLRQTMAIRLKCLDCCCYQQGEVNNCPIEACSLWSYRLGRSLNVPVKTLNIIRKKASKGDDGNDKQE
jgi:hypothetical protein